MSGLKAQAHENTWKNYKQTGHPATHKPAEHSSRYSTAKAVTGKAVASEPIRPLTAVNQEHKAAVTAFRASPASSHHKSTVGAKTPPRVVENRGSKPTTSYPQPPVTTITRDSQFGIGLQPKQVSGVGHRGMIREPARPAQPRVPESKRSPVTPQRNLLHTETSAKSQKSPPTPPTRPDTLQMQSSKNSQTSQATSYEITRTQDSLVNLDRQRNQGTVSRLGMSRSVEPTKGLGQLSVESVNMPKHHKHAWLLWYNEGFIDPESLSILSTSPLLWRHLELFGDLENYKSAPNPKLLRLREEATDKLMGQLSKVVTLFVAFMLENSAIFAQEQITFLYDYPPTQSNDFRAIKCRFCISSRLKDSEVRVLSEVFAEMEDLRGVSLQGLRH